MRNLKRLKQRFGEKGLSNIVTTLLLIAVGIAGVGIVSGVMMGMKGAGSISEAHISDANLIVTGSTSMAAITVKNVGTTGIGPCGVQIYVGAIWTPVENKTSIPVGGTITFSNPAFSAAIVAGTTYNVKLATSDGSYVIFSTVLAR